MKLTTILSVLISVLVGTPDSVFGQSKIIKPRESFVTHDGIRVEHFGLAGSVLINESVTRNPDRSWRKRTAISIRPGARVRIEGVRANTSVRVGQDCDAFVRSSGCGFQPDGTPIRGAGFSLEGLRANLVIQGDKNAVEVPLGGLPDWDFAYSRRIRRPRPGTHADLAGPKLSLIGDHNVVRVSDPDFPFRVLGFENRVAPLSGMTLPDESAFSVISLRAPEPRPAVLERHARSRAIE